MGWPSPNAIVIGTIAGTVLAHLPEFARGRYVSETEEQTQPPAEPLRFSGRAGVVVDARRSPRVSAAPTAQLEE